MLEKRLAIPSAQRQWAANCIADKITQDEAFQQASHVAVYMPSHGEIDIRPIIQRAWGEKKYCYLPIMQPDNHLAWAPYHQDTPLELIATLKPDFIVKGDEYTKQKVIGADIVTARGGKVVLIPTLDGHSTSNLASS